MKRNHIHVIGSAFNYYYYSNYYYVDCQVFLIILLYNHRKEGEEILWIRKFQLQKVLSLP